MTIYTRNEVLLSIEGVTQKYEGKEVLSDINIEIKNLHSSDASQVTGQVIAFLGPSGSGKSQLLRIISGLQKPTKGGVFIDPDRKPIKKGVCGGFVFQKYPLFENRRVLSNLILAGKVGGMTRVRAELHAMELLEALDLQDYYDKFPAELSGGMQQRVAISQQLMNMDADNALYTRLLLMDEPFAALDPRNVQKTCRTVRRVADMHDTNTIIVVTHDIRAALAIGDIVWVMGRDRDAAGKVCSGGKIVKQYDLVEQGLTWTEHIETLPAFSRLEREISELFYNL